MFNLLMIWCGNKLPRYKPFNKIRFIFYKLGGMKIEKRITCFGGVYISTSSTAPNIFIGKLTFLNSEIRFAAPKATISIGKRCHIGPRVSFETVSHKFQTDNSRVTSHDSITIEDNVWLGAGVIVCPGVTIGANSTIAAGAVVVSDVPNSAIFGGVPAKKIK